jgi:acylphosphatase
VTEVVRVRVHVRGRVQGVWFRETCRREAVAAGVAGWVRNLGDGRVQAELEGPPGAVARMVAWCREGPPRARVDAVDTEVLAPTGAAGFRVR